jgi:hypothetical protein
MGDNKQPEASAPSPAQEEAEELRRFLRPTTQQYVSERHVSHS